MLSRMDPSCATLWVKSIDWRWPPGLVRRCRKTKMLHGKRPSKRTRIGSKAALVLLAAALMVCSEAEVPAAQVAPIGSQSSVGTTLPRDFPVIFALTSGFRSSGSERSHRVPVVTFP